MNVSVVAVLWYGGHPAWSGPIPVGNLIAFINYAGQVLFSLLMVSNIVVNISQAKVSADRVHEVLATEPSIAGPAGAGAGTIRAGRVAFLSVSLTAPPTAS